MVYKQMALQYLYGACLIGVMVVVTVHQVKSKMEDNADEGLPSKTSLGTHTRIISTATTKIQLFKFSRYGCYNVHVAYLLTFKVCRKSGSTTDHFVLSKETFNALLSLPPSWTRILDE